MAIPYAKQFSGDDWLTQGQAERLAGRIREYWAMRGENVNVRLERFSTNARTQVTYVTAESFAIRSDLIGGQPHRHPMVKP